MKKLNIPKDIKKYVFKRRIPYAIFFLLLIGIVAFICISSEYIPLAGMIIGPVIAFIIFYDLPVFKNNLFDKTWAGEIVKIKDLSVEVLARGSTVTYIAFGKYAKRSAAFIMLTLKNEDKVFEKIIRLPKNTPLNTLTDLYEPGNIMIHIGGTKQYMVFNENQKNLICPVCGIENPVNADKCFDCGHTLIRSLKSTEN